MDWRDISTPHWQYSSADGLIDADVTFDEYSGGWIWDASICVLVDKPDGNRLFIGDKPANLIARQSGCTHTPEEAKQAAERWITANANGTRTS